MKVSFTNFSFAYGPKNIINNLTFNIESGSFLTIIGKNGTGKTTLIKCLLKTLKVPNNCIYLDDVDINNIPHFKNIGYVPQTDDFNAEFPITVYEVLWASCRYPNYNLILQKIIKALELDKFLHDNINTLSGGQMQRVFIARALLTLPKLLVLDEPTIGIDSGAIKSLYNILKKLKQNNTTIILVTHDAQFCADLTDYQLFLHSEDNYEFRKKVNL